MNCCQNVGALAKLAIGLSAGTPTRMDFISVHSTRYMKILSDGSIKTIRGTLDPSGFAVGEGMLFTQFRTRFWMTAAKMDILLPLLGFTESPTDTFTLGDSISETKVVIGPGGSKEVTYDGCIPSDWYVLGRKGGEPFMIDIGWYGKTRTTADAGTFFTSQTVPAMTEGYTYPYPDGSYNDTVYTVWSIARAFPMVRLAMDYGTIVEYNNSVTPTTICPTKHDLTFSTSALYSTCDSTTDLLETPMSGDTTGGNLTINLTRTVSPTTYRTQFAVANAKAIAQAPNIDKPDWIRLPINLRGYSPANGTPMLVVTNIAT